MGALASLGSVLVQLVEDSIRPLGGSLGMRVRRAWYRRRLRRCGSNLTIGAGVHLDQPQYMSFGDWVCLDRNVIITAGPAGREDHTQVVANPRCPAAVGEVIIGNRCHVAIGCIIQGHGGLAIGDDFTCSAGVMIYTLSNAMRRARNGQVETPDTPVPRVRTPIAIGRNVWLGLNVVVIGGTIGDDCFVRLGSLVTGDLPANSVASGNPAAPTDVRFEAA